MAERIELPAPLQFLLLHELRKPRTGTELAKIVGERRGGGILTPGTIYPALKELHRKRLVSYRSHGREKRWTLRKAGEQELEILYKEFSKMFGGMKSKIYHKPPKNS